MPKGMTKWLEQHPVQQNRNPLKISGEEEKSALCFSTLQVTVSTGVLNKNWVSKQSFLPTLGPLVCLDQLQNRIQAPDLKVD